MKKWLSSTNFSYSTFVEEKKKLYLFYFLVIFSLILKPMTYITAFMFSMLLLALVIVWSLIEIYMDLRKDEKLESEF